MNTLDLNTILQRQPLIQRITDILHAFNHTKRDLTCKRGIYIYGAPGTGKTEFVLQILRSLNYDVIHYDAGDMRNKPVIDAITKHNMADKSVLSLFYKQAKPIAIVMDEIDGMNNGDKGGINSLIKLIRPKKSKKQKTEDISDNPIICISSYHVDKKIKELMKVCYTFELQAPTANQIGQILRQLMPNLDVALHANLIDYIQGDLRKLKAIYNIYSNQLSLLKSTLIQNIFKPKSYNEDTKDITRTLLEKPANLADHNVMMNETDRTIVGLLWHENVVDVLAPFARQTAVPLYTEILDKMCFADYIDRVTFQKQIWQFNEMSSLMKTFNANKLLHDTLNAVHAKPSVPAEIRFTKVLTKYSSEYNNGLFVQGLCQQLGMDKKDMFAFFMQMRASETAEDDLQDVMQTYDISKLDVNRIYRYLDKYTNEACVPGSMDEQVIDEFIDEVDEQE